MAVSPASLIDRRFLFVEQKTKIFELRNQFKIKDETGQVIGAVEQVEQSPLAVLTRIFSDLDVELPVTLEVRGAQGEPQLRLHKPWFRLRMDVSDPATGAALGSVVKRIRVGKARFAMIDATGNDLGAIYAENWRARDFRIEGASGVEVGRVTKKWEGIAKALFTDADNYMIDLPETLTGPLRPLALAAALVIDTIMKQKDYN